MTEQIKPQLVHDSDLNEITEKLQVKFVKSIEAGLSPSESLRKLISDYPKLVNSSEDWLTIKLLRAAYPDIELQNIGGWLYENHYPERIDLLSDKEFDERIFNLVEQAK